MQQNWHGTVGNFYRSNIGSNIGLDSPEYFQALSGEIEIQQTLMISGLGEEVIKVKFLVLVL